MEQHELADVERLCQVPLITRLKGALPVLGARERSQRQCRNASDARLPCAQCPHELVAVHLGHPDVADQNGRLGHLERSKGVGCRAEPGNLRAVILQYLLEYFLPIGFVVDDKRVNAI